MIKKYLKYFRIARIDVQVYRMTKDDVAAVGPIDFTVESDVRDGKRRYFINDSGNFVHNSFVFPKLRLLKLLGKTGPAIGQCVTNPQYRGRSIYPHVINLAARKELSNGKSEVFIIVNSDNASSIRGIEKAGFKFYASVTAKRFLMFYFDVRIVKSR